MLKKVTGFFVALLGIVALAIALTYGMNYLRYRQSPEYRLASDLEKIEEAYANDPYGGETPEETLQLFIAALKQGDIELASKYFILADRNEWLIELEQIQNKSLLEFMISDLEKIELTKKEAEKAFYIVTNDQNEVTTQMVIIKNSLNGKWKIRDL